MERVRETIAELEIIDPVEWHNIPKPIIRGIIILKNCVQSQFDFFEYFYKHFQDFENRCNLKIVNVQKSISENIEKIKENDDTNKNLIKSLDQKAKENIDFVHKKITEEISNFKSKNTAELEIINEKIVLCSQKAEECPTVHQIQAMINESGEKIREKSKQEIFENFIAPEVDLLNKKIFCLDM